MSSPPGSRQLSLFLPSQSPLVTLDPHHRLVKLCDLLDWPELEAIAQDVRRRKLKSRAGRRPNLRALVGAVVLMGTRRMTYREAEDQIRHYGPARYLCGLTDSTWTPDFTTIQDFTELMGPDGMKALNEFVLQGAQQAEFLNLDMVVGDTTAQEASMSYPTEVGLMAGFLRMASKACKRGGSGLRALGSGLKAQFQKGRRLVGKYRFFSKTKEERLSTGQKLLNVVKGIKGKLGRALTKTRGGKSRLKKYAKVARSKLELLHSSMGKLIPQIQYWLETGWVAKGKLVNLLMQAVCSIPRGKVGKDVEFGIKWGVTRFGGGFLAGAADPARGNFSDKKHALEAVQDSVRMFGHAPAAYAYDRGGHSERNVKAVAALGVKQVGIAPCGQAPWPVDGAARKRIKKQRVTVEGSIGALKSSRYAFNRPNVRSTHMMMTCGHRSILGYNLNRLLHHVADSEGFALVG
jgi:hypothetical protein